MSDGHHRGSRLTYRQTLVLSSLESLVIDEADLILSYGHDEDVRQIFGGGYLPTIYQSFLMSATMTDDVETLKGLALRNPVRSFQCSPLKYTHPFSFEAILKLEEDDEGAPLLTQYFVRYAEHLADSTITTYTTREDAPKLTSFSSPT